MAHVMNLTTFSTKCVRNRLVASLKTRCVRNGHVVRLSTSCNNAVISSSCCKAVAHNLLTNVELHDGNKLLEQFVSSLLILTTL